MLSNNNLKICSIGFALFSMFFGSGNLIFPLVIGLEAGESWIWASIGFLLTGVLLPFLGAFTMVIFRGSVDNFFDILGKRGGFVFTLLLLSAWIPFGSGPRCVVLSYANILPYLGGAPLWVYSIVYCAILLLISFKRSRALDILGYVLTPLLLLSLAAVIFLGIYNSPGFTGSTGSSMSILLHGLIEGYQTQDLIASFFFASTVIHIISKSGNGKNSLKLTLHASILGIGLLGAVYIGLILLAASSGTVLEGVSKDALLATLVAKLLPSSLAFIGSLTVALACMTTSVALTLVFAEFLHHSVWKEKTSIRWMIILTVVMTYAMSLLGFNGIAAIISLLMQLFYPILILLIVANLVFRRPAIQVEA